MNCNNGEITPETRLLLIELAEGIAESLRKGTMCFTEGNARALAVWADTLLHPEKSKPATDGIHWKNATQICDYIGFTPQTFRTYVRKGVIPKGEKVRGFTEPVWKKEDIDTFAQWYFSHRRKR